MFYSLDDAHIADLLSRSLDHVSEMGAKAGRGRQATLDTAISEREMGYIGPISIENEAQSVDAVVAMEKAAQL